MSKPQYETKQIKGGITEVERVGGKRIILLGETVSQEPVIMITSRVENDHSVSAVAKYENGTLCIWSD